MLQAAWNVKCQFVNACYFRFHHILPPDITLGVSLIPSISLSTKATAMCHGHPRWHPCSHTSINWHYCPSALIDLETGIETPCTHLSYANAQPSNADCPLLNCQFKAMSGSWTCCQCGHGPNTQGWCTMPKSMQDISGMNADGAKTCDHGCCAECTRYRKSSSCDARFVPINDVTNRATIVSTQPTTPDMSFRELRKGTASRKFGYGSATRSHRRGSAVSKIHGFLVDEEETLSPAISGSSSSRSSVSYKSSISSSKFYRSSASKNLASAYSVDPECSSKSQTPLRGKQAKKAIY